MKELQELGLSSLYHRERSEAQGKESTPTFFMNRKRERPYHIDYAFLSEVLLPAAAVEIGRPDSWLEHSDHMPFIVRIMANHSLKADAPDGPRP